ncbi:T9SS type A sorting domain-containing protein [Putridiphycobacter roseus]|nr:T9SS type A sorting domain-containing protein [Putridiphycobacter roseus]
MKNSIAILSVLLLNSFSSHSQAQINLNFNQTNATVNTNGVLFYDTINQTAGYEVPKNLGNHAIYSSSFWFGGEDVNGQLKLAAQKYHTDSDFSTGPLSTFSGGLNNGVPYGDAQTNAASIALSNKIFTMDKSTIQNFITWWNCENGITPQSQCNNVVAPSNNEMQQILNWPAHGDVALAQDYNMAPFYDNPNGPEGANGKYDPLIDGDYPCVPGHSNAFILFNDKGGVHSSGGDPIGLEFHMMVYQYASNDFLDNTTFVNLKVINRSTQTLSNFKVANFTDPMIGDYSDDYVGSNPSKNMVYAYNSDNNDAEYGVDPPAIGVVLLNAPMSVAGVMNNQSGIPAMQTPNLATEYWGYMNGEWGNSGLPFTDGGNGYNGTIPTNYMYDDINNWSEINEGQTPGDRQMFLASDQGTFVPGGVKEYDYAFIYARLGDHLQNVDSLFSIADKVQSFYDGQSSTCPHIFDPTLGTDKVDDQINNISLYPNPAQDQFKIAIEGAFDVEIYSIAGQLIYQANSVQPQQNIATPNHSGIYFVKVRQNGQTTTLKMIIE